MIYGVTTKVFNQAVKRNEGRFPEDFRFRLTQEENRGGRRYLPYAFTEYGALQAANILKSEKAKEMSIYVVRAFVQMRKELAISQEVLKRLAQIDKKLLEHDAVIGDLVHNLIPLLEEPPVSEKPSMGFTP